MRGSGRREGLGLEIIGLVSHHSFLVAVSVTRDYTRTVDYSHKNAQALKYEKNLCIRFGA